MARAMVLWCTVEIGASGVWARRVDVGSVRWTAREVVDGRKSKRRMVVGKMAEDENRRREPKGRNEGRAGLLV